MQFEVKSAVEPELHKTLQRGVLAVIEAYFKVDVQPISVVARDESGALIGGLTGRSVASWLSVDLIWVAEAFRGGGVGAKLMQHAEAAARERGLHRRSSPNRQLRSARFLSPAGLPAVRRHRRLPARTPAPLIQQAVR